MLVLEGETSDFSGIRSGDNVAIAGVWLSRGAGGVRAVSGYTRAESTYCFVGTGLQKVQSAARHAAKPMVACEWVGRGAGGCLLSSVSLSCGRCCVILRCPAPCAHPAPPAHRPRPCLLAGGTLPGVPAAATPAAAAAANELISRDAKGLAINSAAPMGVAPNGKAVAAPRALPPAKYLTNDLISPDLRTIIIPRARRQLRMPPPRLA